MCKGLPCRAITGPGILGGAAVKELADPLDIGWAQALGSRGEGLWGGRYSPAGGGSAGSWVSPLALAPVAGPVDFPEAPVAEVLLEESAGLAGDDDDFGAGGAGSGAGEDLHFGDS